MTKLVKFPGVNDKEVLYIDPLSVSGCYESPNYPEITCLHNGKEWRIRLPVEEVVERLRESITLLKFEDETTGCYLAPNKVVSVFHGGTSTRILPAHDKTSYETTEPVDEAAFRIEQALRGAE